MDNLYTSVSLGNELMRRDINILGTVRHNRYLTHTLTHSLTHTHTLPTGWVCQRSYLTPKSVRPTTPSWSGKRKRNKFHLPVMRLTLNQKVSVCVCECVSVCESVFVGKTAIIVLSTLPVQLKTTADDGHFKPFLIKVYDFTKGGTDVADQR